MAVGLADVFDDDVVVPPPLSLLPHAAIAMAPTVALIAAMVRLCMPTSQLRAPSLEPGASRPRLVRNGTPVRARSAPARCAPGGRRAAGRRRRRAPTARRRRWSR